MAKTRLTKDIENALFAWKPDSVAGQKINRHRETFGAYEVPVTMEGKSDGIIDFVFVADCYIAEEKNISEDNTYCQKIRTMQAGIIAAAIEIKVSKSDFHSEHGHNFVGDANFYAIPYWMYSQVHKLIPKNIGILLYYEGRGDEHLVDASVPEGFQGIVMKRDSAYTPMTDVQRMWLIHSAAKRALNRKDKLIDDLVKENSMKSDNFRHQIV